MKKNIVGEPFATLERSPGERHSWGNPQHHCLTRPKGVFIFPLLPFVFLSSPKQLSPLELFLVTEPTNKSLHMRTCLNSLQLPVSIEDFQICSTPFTSPPPFFFFFPYLLLCKLNNSGEVTAKYRGLFL